MLHLSIDEVEAENSTNNSANDDDLLRSMSDDDILFHHIASDDHELYRLDCCLSELFATGAN